VIFVDTWAWRAKALGEADPWHSIARRAWRELIQTREPLLTTWMVVDEVVNSVAMHASSQWAAKVYRAILASPG
jgi:predicted nucleic acid-binding protein